MYQTIEALLIKLKEKGVQLNNKYLNIILISLLILAGLNHVFFQQGVIYFGISILITLAIIIKAQLSILSLLAVLGNYPLVALTYQEFTGTSYGILEISSQQIGLHYYGITLAAFIFNYILLFIVFYTDFLSYEKQVLNKKYTISKVLTNIFCLIAIAATIIYLPRFSLISGINGETRFEHLLPGNAWNYVAIVAILFTTLSAHLSIFQIFTYVFVVFWFFFNYERVDMLGLSILLALRYYKIIWESPIVSRIKYKKTILFALLTTVITFLFASSHLREGRGFNLIAIAKDLLVQTTSCDIMHVFNTSFDYVNNIGFSYGQTYLNYIYKLIPGLGNDLDYSSILNHYIANPGGGYFLTEPYMNFGYLGVILFSLLLLGSIYWMVKKSNAYAYLMYACLVAASFRIMWYGLIYIHKSFIMIIPAFFVFMILFDKYGLPLMMDKFNKMKFKKER